MTVVTGSETPVPRATQRPLPTGAGRRRDPVVVSLLATLAALATVVATRHGPGLSPDSVTYLSLARNLANGRGFVDFTGRADTTFAPGFPLLIAAGLRLGLSASGAVRLLNAASFAAIVVLAWRLLRRHTASKSAALVGTALIACSPALLGVSDEAWSEPLFCAICLGFLLLLEDAAGKDDTGHLALAAGFVAGIAFCVRYAGASLVLVGAVVLLLAARDTKTLRARAHRTAQFLLAASLLPVAWVVRNATTTNPYLMGPRIAEHASPVTLARLLVDGVAELFVPRTFTTAWFLVAVPLMVAATAGGVSLLLGRAHDRRAGSTPSTPTTALAAFLGVYSIFLLFAGKTTGASIDSRTVIPLYVPAVIVAVCAVELVVARSRRRVPPEAQHSRVRFAARRLIPPLVLAYVAFGAAWFLQTSIDDGSAARGYATGETSRSALALAARRLPGDAVVVTNEPWSLYAATGHQPIEPSPRPLVPSDSIIPATADEIARATCTRSVFVAWFGTPDIDGGMVADRLPVTLVRRVPDGDLFRLVREAAPCRSATKEPAGLRATNPTRPGSSG
jgi:4-amino-4-deoxy-L-arabinose transferase-like glycosyltransferase